MEGIKKFVNILVMLYLVAAALIYLGILNVGQESNPGFYTTFFLVGGILMLLELIVENLYIASLKRGFGQTQQKINELKANLYDHKQEIQDLRNKHAEELAAATAARPVSTTTTTVTPAATTPVTPAAPAYTTTTAPLTAAPTGSEPVPPVVHPTAPVPPAARPVEPLNNPPGNSPNVIITPSPGSTEAERRRIENSDT
jgi:hypothetical protein